MMELEEESLTYFGLPVMAYQYSSLMQLCGFSDKDVDQKADDLYRKLENESQSYLLAPVKPDTEILKEGKSSFKDAQEVLPFIGCGTNEYTRFLYHDIYLRDKCSEAGLIKALRVVDGVSGFLSIVMLLLIALI